MEGGTKISQAMWIFAHRWAARDLTVRPYFHDQNDRLKIATAFSTYREKNARPTVGISEKVVKDAKVANASH